MPSSISAGAAIVTVIMYAGILGKPIPSSIQVTIVKTSVNNKLFPPSEIIALAILMVKPVKLDTPITIPTQAQAIATDTVDFAEATKAASISFKLMRVSFFSCAIMIVKRMVKKAPLITV